MDLKSSAAAAPQIGLAFLPAIDSTFCKKRLEKLQITAKSTFAPRQNA
jgi:hypothetical protein